MGNKLPLFIGRIINPSGKTIQQKVQQTPETQENRTETPNISSLIQQIRQTTSQNQNIKNETIFEKLTHEPIEANITMSQLVENWRDCMERKQNDTELHKEAVIFPCTVNNIIKSIDSDDVDNAEE